MLIDIISPEQFHTMPWKNGGGSTLELFRLTQPGCDDFAVRLSIASVNGNGPFSLFDRVDRHLILLTGSGVQLTFADGSRVNLERPLQTVSFAGELPCESELNNGPIQDFNLMVHRDFGSGSLSVITLAEGDKVRSIAKPLCFYYLLEGEADMAGHRVRTQHLIAIQNAKEILLHSKSGALIICAMVTPK